MSSPLILSLITSILETHSTLRLQLDSLQKLILAPPEPDAPPSPSNTLLVPGGTPFSPAFITDSSHQTWTLSPNGPSATPTLFLNGHPDPFTGPASLALYLNDTLYFQRITGQWFLWSINRWIPSPDPTTPTAPEWGPPALRSSSAIPFNWLPASLNPPPNYDLLTDLFTDTSPRAETFLPSPIPLVTRPRGLPTPTIYQRSDNTFLIPIHSSSTPTTFQFPGLRPSFIRLWQAQLPPSAHHEYQPGKASTPPLRVATGTDTIAVPITRNSLFIIELSLG